MAKKTNPANRILDVMKSVAQPNPAYTPNILTGVVETADPLSIKVDNRLIITESFLILSPWVEPSKHFHIIPQHVTETAGEHPHTHDILPFNSDFTNWNGLAIGDNVLMLRVNNGQTYYVLQKYEGLIWNETSEVGS